MRIYIALGALLGGLSVLLGAFGAHSLKAILTEKSLATFVTATQYMMYHSLALLAIGILSLQEEHREKVKTPGKFFLAGVLLFSGSLYILAFGGPKIFGPITPLGGLCFMIGWFTLAITYFKKP
jgi:uncharacterized membrane protein YgdD (TMEM256/DUF423 family)